jgi:hypothetical protein
MKESWPELHQMGLNIHVHRILCFVSPEFFIATYRLYTGKLNMLFFSHYFKVAHSFSSLLSFSGNYREDGRAWEAGMKRNNGVVYISIGRERYSAQSTSYLHIFYNSLYLLCIIFASLSLSQTANQCMCLFNVSWGYRWIFNCTWGFQFHGKAKDPLLEVIW